MTEYIVENGAGPIAVVSSSETVARAVTELYENARYRRVNKAEAKKVRIELLHIREQYMQGAFEGETILERIVGSAA